MSITDIVLLVVIVLLFIFCLYDRLIINQLHGKTQLAISLLQRNRSDGIIFTGLVAILLYQNIQTNGAPFTTWLLTTLILLSIYLIGFRQPKLIFKNEGFFFSGIWFRFTDIREINLSEDGILVIQFEKRRLLIRVKNINDLEKIYSFIL